MTLPSGRAIRLIAAPVFVATKLEAFAGRGREDFMLSHDLEDLLAVIDGRASLIEECRASAPELRGYLGKCFSALLSVSAFIDALSGHLPGDAASQARLPEMLEKLRLLSRLGAP